eukprot:451490_1
MKIKIVQNKQIRVWKYPSRHKYKSLLKFISKSFRLSNPLSFRLQYQDDEDDTINILNDHDINDAIFYAKQESRKSLKIFVISVVNDFLDDALPDIFSHPKPIQQKQFKPIPIPKPIPKPKPKHKKKKKIKNIPIKSIPKPKSNTYTSPPLIPNNKFMQTYPASKSSEMDKISPQKIIPLQNKQMKAKQSQDILASMMMFEDKKMDKNENIFADMNIDSSKQFEHKLDMEIDMDDKSELLLENLLNNPPKELNKKKDNKFKSDEDLLSNLLTESEEQIYKNKQEMNAQDIINSIVNNDNIVSVNENEYKVDIDNNNEDNDDINENIDNYNNDKPIVDELQLDNKQNHDANENDDIHNNEIPFVQENESKVDNNNNNNIENNIYDMNNVNINELEMDNNEQKMN